MRDLGAITSRSDLTAKYAAPSEHCSDVALQLFVDGNLAATTPFTSPSQTTSVTVRWPKDRRPHHLGVEAVGREGGCNQGTLLAWSGTLTVVFNKSTRLIAGQVVVSCPGRGSCSRLPVLGARITASATAARGASSARTYRATTGADGRYEIEVPKGRYRVSASAAPLRIRSRSHEVDLRTHERGTANFQACGLGSARASAARVDGGTWKNVSLKSCRDSFTIDWSPSRAGSAPSLQVTWFSAPECGGHAVDLRQAKYVVRNARVTPGAEGHALNIQAQRVGFTYPIDALGDTVSGELLGDGTGSAAGSLHEGGCTYGGPRIPLRKVV